MTAAARCSAAHVGARRLAAHRDVDLVAVVQWRRQVQLPVRKARIDPRPEPAGRRDGVPDPRTGGELVHARLRDRATDLDNEQACARGRGRRAKTDVRGRRGITDGAVDLDRWLGPADHQERRDAHGERDNDRRDRDPRHVARCRRPAPSRRVPRLRARATARRSAPRDEASPAGSGRARGEGVGPVGGTSDGADVRAERYEGRLISDLCAQVRSVEPRRADSHGRGCDGLVGSL